MSDSSISLLGDEIYALQLQLEDLEVQRNLASSADFKHACSEYEADLRQAMREAQARRPARERVNEGGSNQANTTTDSNSLLFEIDHAVDNGQGSQSTAGQAGTNQTTMNVASTKPDALENSSIDNGPDRTKPKSKVGSSSMISSALSHDLASDTSSAGSSSRNDSPDKASSNPSSISQSGTAEGLNSGDLECSVCRDTHPSAQTVQMSCPDKHVWCRHCVKEAFMLAVRDESLFPPKCDKSPIDISVIKEDLSDQEVQAYKAAEMEYTAPDRVYCASSSCGKFIPKYQRTPDHASCEACGKRTCMYCKALEHGGECPEDVERQRLFEFGQREGLQICTQCRHMVIRINGCNHMSCRCGFQFCYVCGKTWRTCGH